MRETVELAIPFESLIGAVEKLNLAEKRQLWEVLEEELAQAWEESPEVQAEVSEARAAYEAGDYLTIDDYIPSGIRELQRHRS